MNLLLDTHIALWSLVGDKRLTRSAIELIADADNRVFVSAASVWEIAIKHALRGRSGIPFPATAALDYFDEAGYKLLDVSARHTAAVEALPPLHADPFDRLLVAQAQTEPLRLLTHDRQLAAYGDTILLI